MSRNESDERTGKRLANRWRRQKITIAAQAGPGPETKSIIPLIDAEMNCCQAVIRHFLLALLCGLPGAFAVSAQTVTNLLDQFNPSGVGTNSYAGGQIGNVWGNWFGGAFQSLAWDGSSDANNNPGSGSLKITANFPVNTDQFTVWDGINGISPALNGVVYTNFQCDIRFAPGSATAGGSFGNVEFGQGTPGYGQDYWPGGSVSVAADNTNWVHVSIPLNVSTDTNLYNIANVFIHIWGAGLVGPSSLWVDNIEFVGMATNVGTAVLDYTNTRQRMDGFGASCAWYSGMSAADADLLFSTNKGVGLSLLRTRIAPGGVIDDGEGTIAQLAQARGARVWSTPWSPAANFKTINSVNGGSYVDTPANNQALASEVAGYVGAMKSTYGVNLYAVSVQNEPDVSTDYESCLWTSRQIHDYVPALAAALVAGNFTSTRIILPEDEFWQWNLASNTMSDTTTSNLVGILAAHNYNNGGAAVTAFGTPCPKTIWETEHYLDTDDSITNGLQLAQELHAFLTVAQASAYHYWWLTGNGTGSLADNPANPAKRLYVMGNYSLFVRPNFYRFEATNSSAALITAFKPTNSPAFVIVAANPNPIAVNQTFTLTHFPASGTLTQWVTSATLSLANQGAIYVTNQSFDYVLQPCSVVTFTFSPMAPAVTIVPAATNLVYGSPVVLTASATGTGPLGYQWYFNQTNLLAGATQATFTNRPAVAASGTYSVMVTNPIGRVTNLATVTVTPARLTVTASSTNVPYATPLPGFSATYSGLVGTDTLAGAVSGAPAFSTPATNGSDPGHYPILLSAGTLTASNYSFNFVNGTVTILPATYRTNIIATGNATTFTITWPASHTGWTLQVQTNALASGLGTNWADVAGSSATNQVVVPLNPAPDAMFYRLRQ